MGYMTGLNWKEPDQSLNFLYISLGCYVSKMHIYIEEICETFRKKFTSRVCENPPVKSNQNYIHSYSTRCTEHIIQPHPKLNKAHLILWDSRFNTNIDIVGHSQPKK